MDYNYQNWYNAMVGNYLNPPQQGPLGEMDSPLLAQSPWSQNYAYGTAPASFSGPNDPNLRIAIAKELGREMTGDNQYPNQITDLGSANAYLNTVQQQGSFGVNDGPSNFGALDNPITRTIDKIGSNDAVQKAFEAVVMYYLGAGAAGAMGGSAGASSTAAGSEGGGYAAGQGAAAGSSAGAASGGGAGAGAANYGDAAYGSGGINASSMTPADYGASGSVAGASGSGGGSGGGEAATNTDISTSDLGTGANASGNGAPMADTSGGFSFQDIWNFVKANPSLAGSALGALLGGAKGGSQPAGTVTTTQDLAPWLQPYAQANVMQGAQTLAGINPNNPLLPASQNEAMKTIRGDYLNPNSNPYLAQSVNDSLGLARAQLNSQFTGAFGDPNNSGANEAIARGLGATATNAYMSNFQNERARQATAAFGAPQLVSQANAAYFSPNQAFSGLFPNVTSTQTPYFQNQLGSIFGGALAGGALGKAFGG